MAKEYSNLEEYFLEVYGVRRVYVSMDNIHWLFVKSIYPDGSGVQLFSDFSMYKYMKEEYEWQSIT